MNLFSILTKANAVKGAVQNPRNAASEFIKGIIEGYAVLIGFWLLVIIGVLSVLGFTDWLGGPFDWAQIVLYVFLALTGLLLISVITIYRVLKAKLKKLQSDITTKVGATFATPVKPVDSTNKSKRPASTTARLNR